MLLSDVELLDPYCCQAGKAAALATLARRQDDKKKARQPDRRREHRYDMGCRMSAWSMGTKILGR